MAAACVRPLLLLNPYSSTWYRAKRIVRTIMIQIHTRIRVDTERRITGVAPLDVPPGEHEATITLVPGPDRRMPARKPTIKDLPSHHIPWDDSISLHREDMYDGNGH